MLTELSRLFKEVSGIHLERDSETKSSNTSVRITDNAVEIPTQYLPTRRLEQGFLSFSATKT
jgi:hypothetical protein